MKNKYNDKSSLLKSFAKGKYRIKWKNNTFGDFRLILDMKISWPTVHKNEYICVTLAYFVILPGPLTSLPQSASVLLVTGKGNC